MGPTHRPARVAGALAVSLAAIAACAPPPLQPLDAAARPAPPPAPPASYPVPPPVWPPPQALPELPDAGPVPPDGSPPAEVSPEPDAAVAPPDSSPDAPALGPFPFAAVRAARPTRLVSLATHNEGPTFRDGDLFFASDGNGLMRLAADGRLFRYHPSLQPVGSYRLADGSLLLCDQQHILVQMFRDGRVGLLPSTFQGARIGFCNDVTVDGAGNVFFTDARGGNIFRVTPGGEVARVLSGRPYPNGIEVDPASKYLYFSSGGMLWRIALPPAGAAFPAPQPAGGPSSDGMAFDVWGNLWLTQVGPGRLSVFDPVRRAVIASIDAGAGGTTNVTFGGPGDDVLYTTVSRVGVFRIPAGVRGFLHPGAPRYTIVRMLAVTPADEPVR